MSSLNRTPPAVRFPSRRRLRSWGVVASVALALWFARDRLSLSSARPNRLRFVHSFTTASEKAIIDDAVAAFEQSHPGLSVDQVVFNSETYQNIGWRLQFQGSRQSDVFFTWLGFKTRQASEQGWSLDLSPHLSEQDLAQFVPTTLGRNGDKIDFLPQSVDLSNLVWYNQQWFRTNALSEPTSQAEWLAHCEKLRGPGSLAMVQGNREYWPMGNFGAELMGRSLGLARLNELFLGRLPARAETLAGLQLLVDFARQGSFDAPGVLAPGSIGSLSDLDAKVLFLSGKAAQHPIGSWFTADIRDARDHHELRFDPGVFGIPPGPNETPARTAVVTGYQVNSRTRHPREAVEFLKLLLSRPYQERFAALGNLSARRDATAFTTEPIPRRLLQILAEPAAMVPPPDTGYSPERAALFYELCSDLLLGKLDLTQAASHWNRQQILIARKER